MISFYFSDVLELEVYKKGDYVVREVSRKDDDDDDGDGDGDDDNDDDDGDNDDDDDDDDASLFSLIRCSSIILH